MPQPPPDAVYVAKHSTEAGVAEEILAALLPIDGPGSGLDADKLDGSHASAFLAIAHAGSRDGHPTATAALDGFMAATDKSKLNNIAPEATANPAYTHVQGTPATLWTVNHNLGRRPSVTVVDSGGNVVYGNINYVNNNTLTLTFGAGFGGEALCS